MHSIALSVTACPTDELAMTTLSLHRFRTRWTCPVGLLGLFVALCVQTWRRWPDLLIDFGRELYIPWQLADGAVLYRDIAYFNGPLSPYGNALLFRCFGASLLTLVVANLITIALIGVVLYRLISPRYGRAAAKLACAVFLCGFAFAHLKIIGNYNFVCPYSHELTHGIAFSLFTLALLTSGGFGSKWKVAAAGLLWGFVFLGKPEVFLALSGATAILFGTRFMERAVPWQQTCAACVQFLASGAVAVLLMAAFLSLQMPVIDALLNTAGAWRWLLTTEVANQTFYEAVAGLDQPWWNIVRMLIATTSVSFVLAATVLIDRWKHRSKSRDLVLAILLLVSAPLLSNQWFPLLLRERSLLIVTAAILLGLGVLVMKNGWRQLDFERWAAPLAWTVFALLMLAKLLLAPKFYHYGFALALPATLLAVVVAVAWLPKVCCRSWQGGRWCQIAIVAICILDLGYLVHTSSHHLSMKTQPFGSGDDRIVGFGGDVAPRDIILTDALEFISRDLPPGATVAALPEGVMLNYQARRVNSTGYINLMPPELEMFGEENIVRSFAARPPDYVLLVHKDTDEYGVRFFGSSGYGEQIMQWVLDHYTPVRTFGAEPLCGDRFGVKILQRLP
jgi:hypothetical protein